MPGFAIEGRDRVRRRIRYPRTQRHVWAAAIVMAMPRPQNRSQMGLGDRDEPIQTFALVVPCYDPFKISPALSPVTHPFLRRTGCEPNRAKHPSGSSTMPTAHTPWWPRHPRRTLVPRLVQEFAYSSVVANRLAPVSSWLATQATRIRLSRGAEAVSIQSGWFTSS
jgi:hypothetical protein